MKQWDKTKYKILIIILNNVEANEWSSSSIQSQVHLCIYVLPYSVIKTCANHCLKLQLRVMLKKKNNN